MRTLIAFGLVALALWGGWCALQAPDDGPLVRPADEEEEVRDPVRLAPGARSAPLVVTEPPHPVTVRGRVVDLNGRPVAGAVLRWVIDDEEVATSRTDAAGCYVIHGPKQLGDLDISYGECQRARVWLYTEDRTNVPVRLREGRKLTGVVRAFDGTPAAGAKVTMYLEEFGRTETKADVHGRFCLVPVPAAGPFSVSVEAGRHGRVTLEHVIWTEGADLEVELPPVFSVRGHVIRGDSEGGGRGVEGVRIVSRIGHHATDGPGTITDVDGRFLLEGLTEDGYLGIVSSEWNRHGRGARTRAGIGEVLLRVVPREAMRRIRGRVVDDAEVPRAGVTVEARYCEDVISEADGSFEIAGALSREITIWAADGEWYGQARVREEEDAGGVRLILTRRPFLLGRVVDDGGEPIPYASVDVECTVKREAHTVTYLHHARGGADGTFHLHRLQAHPCEVEIEVAGHATYVQEGVVPRVGGHDLGDLVLARCTRRTGRVTDANGTPVPTASYRIDTLVNYRDVPVNSDGTFEVDVAPDGSFEWLRVKAPGYVPWEIKPEGPLYPERFDVVLARAHTLHGRVIDVRDRPVPGAQVRTWGPPGKMIGEQRTWTDLKGEFRLEVTMPGSYVVHVTHDALFVERGHTVSTDDEVVVLRALVPGRIAGEVFDLRGRPLAGVEVKVRRPTEFGAQDTVTAEDGRFCFDDLKGIAFDVQIDESPDRLGFRPVRGVALGREDLVFRAEPTSEISGVVTWLDGAPAVDVDVEACPVGHDAIEAWSCTDEQGRFAIDGLVDGHYRLEASTYLEIDEETDQDYVGLVGPMDVGTSGHRIVLRPVPLADDREE